MKHADLIWDETGTPCSTQFDDVYFSKVGGLDETRHVFLNHNQLTERFEALKSITTPQSFVIAETGFGTGLNFLAACQLWQQILGDTDHRLIFISTEKFPLTLPDLTKALSVWPELSHWSEPLIKAYPKLCIGIQTLIIKSNIKLMLAFGDAADSFEELNAEVDAWFLDGFAPSKNPEMWSTALFQQIQRLSKEETTFATFTAARVVKDLLTHHGFIFKKAKGFGRKRDMIHGHFEAHLGQSDTRTHSKPWFQAPIHSSREDQRSAIVIGAGLAGAHTANRLAQRGWQVRVLEQAGQIAAGASGNYQGVLYTKPAVQETKEDLFYQSSFQYAVQDYKSKFEGSEIWQQTGLLQLAATEKEDQKLGKVALRHEGSNFCKALSREQANELSGVDLTSQYSSLFYPDSGWVNPAEACKALLDHPNIDVLFNHQVDALEKCDEYWSVRANSNDDNEVYLTAPVVVLAAAWESQALAQADHLPLTPIRGQVTRVATQALPDYTPSPKTVICSDSYVTPIDKEHLNFGATFDLKESDQTYRTKDAQRNIEKLQSLSKDFCSVQEIAETELSGRASVRCITNDRIPAVGMLNDHNAMIEQYAELRKDRKWPYQEPGKYHEGLYVNLGHGSKGLTTIPLCSELVCSMIAGEPLPFPQTLLDALNPTRFTIKGLIKKQF